MASSARRPRSANGTPSNSNSSAKLAHADAEHQSATADEIQRAVSLRDGEGMVITEHQHGSAQTNSTRKRGNVGQRG